MEEHFRLFQRDFRGSDWYICLDCGAKHRGKPDICPVCENQTTLIDEQTKAMIEGMLGGVK